MKTKTFDCVEIKHRAAEKIREQVRGMTRDEERTFWERGTEELLLRQQALRNSREKTESSPADVREGQAARVTE